MGDGANGVAAAGTNGAAGPVQTSTQAPVEGGKAATGSPAERDAEGQGAPSTGTAGTQTRGSDGKFISGSEPPVVGQARKYKLKAKDKEIEVDEPKLLHYAQKAFGSEQYFEEGRKARDEAAAVQSKLEQLKTAKPAEARRLLKELLGTDARLRELSEEEIYEQLQAEKLTPEQKRIRELEGEKAARDREAREAKAKAEKDAEEAETSKLREEFGRLSKAALEKIGLPKNSAWVGVRRLAPRLAKAFEMGETPNADELAEDVRGELLEEHRALAVNMDGQALVDWLGEEVANKIRRWDLQRLRPGAQPTKAAVPANGAKIDEKKIQESKRGRWDLINELERGS